MGFVGGGLMRGHNRMAERKAGQEKLQAPSSKLQSSHAYRRTIWNGKAPVHFRAD
jgi:hypothetical protein